MAAGGEGIVSGKNINFVNVSGLWTDVKIEMLIENVKKYRVLFDVTFKEYKNRILKENAWKKVADVLTFPGWLKFCFTFAVFYFKIRWCVKFCALSFKS